MRRPRGAQSTRCWLAIPGSSRWPAITRYLPLEILRDKFSDLRFKNLSASGLHLVALYATIHAYGTAALLAKARRTELAPTLRNLAGRRASRRQDVSMPEPR